MQILSQHNPWKLPDMVDAEDREDAIVAAVKRGHRVVIVGYRRVSEGLNLQIVDSIVWFEMAQRLILLPQASQRAWRLGKQDEVRIFYLAYAGTVSHDKLKQVASPVGSTNPSRLSLPHEGLSDRRPPSPSATSPTSAKRCARSVRPAVRTSSSRPRRCSDSAPGGIMEQGSSSA
jgi:hypothetical protein